MCSFRTSTQSDAANPAAADEAALGKVQPCECCGTPDGKSVVLTPKFPTAVKKNRNSERLRTAAGETAE